MLKFELNNAFYELKGCSLLYKVTPCTEIHLLLTYTSSFWPHKLSRFKIYHTINMHFMSLAKSSVPLSESITIWTSFLSDLVLQFISFKTSLEVFIDSTGTRLCQRWFIPQGAILLPQTVDPTSCFESVWACMRLCNDLCDELSLSKPASSVDYSRFCLVDLTVFPVTVALVCVLCMKSLMALNISKLSDKTNPPGSQCCWQISSPVIKPQGPFKLYVTVLSLQILFVCNSVRK